VRVGKALWEKLHEGRIKKLLKNVLINERKFKTTRQAQQKLQSFPVRYRLPFESTFTSTISSILASKKKVKMLMFDQCFPKGFLMKSVEQWKKIQE
jgi:hypothetical protein